MKLVISFLLLIAFNLNIAFGEDLIEESSELHDSPDVTVVQAEDQTEKNHTSDTEHPAEISSDHPTETTTEHPTEASSAHPTETPTQMTNPLDAANKNLKALKDLNYNLLLLVIDQFSRVKLPINFVHQLESVISALHLTASEYSQFTPFYEYETMIYGGYNAIRDQMSVFERQIESIPYHDLPATHLVNLAALIDEIVSQNKENMDAIGEIIKGEDYQNKMHTLSEAKMNIENWTVELINLVALYKSEPHSADAITHLEDLKHHILGEIVSFGAEMLELVETFKTSDVAINCYKLYNAIVDRERKLPAIIDFSFIKV